MRYSTYVALITSEILMRSVQVMNKTICDSRSVHVMGVLRPQVTAQSHRYSNGFSGGLGMYNFPPPIITANTIGMR